MSKSRKKTPATNNLNRFLLIIALSTTFGLSGCAVNPVTGKNELSWISTDDEINIGRQQYLPSQQSQGGQFLADPALNDYINEVGKRVANAGDRDLPYEFVVLNNSVPNAWALPGGKIAINRGLLLELKDEAELAAVLGHEAVHAAAKHGANSLQRSQIMQGLVVATSIGASTTDYGNYIVGGAQVGAQMIGQKYGRDAELEADYYGIKYMSLAGYEPAAAIGLQSSGSQRDRHRAGLMVCSQATRHHSLGLRQIVQQSPSSTYRAVNAMQTAINKKFASFTTTAMRTRKPMSPPPPRI